MRSGLSVQQVNTLGKGGRGIDEQGSTRNVSSWLNKNGDVMSIGKISEYLKDSLIISTGEKIKRRRILFKLTFIKLIGC